MDACAVGRVLQLIPEKKHWTRGSISNTQLYYKKVENAWHCSFFRIKTIYLGQDAHVLYNKIIMQNILHQSTSLHGSQRLLSWNTVDLYYKNLKLREWMTIHWTKTNSGHQIVALLQNYNYQAVHKSKTVAMQSCTKLTLIIHLIPCPATHDKTTLPRTELNPRPPTNRCRCLYYINHH